ncbi:unnamed protein product [Brachionus calyciflorus]|uniref:Thioredoxin domain-containing protein n=1 Tax=Brachionus calyciflorus TaxID=104777 RepID=A0A813WNC1_9BILA|nr:unnamed protein product [Brachionus calyciflorus]
MGVFYLNGTNEEFSLIVSQGASLVKYCYPLSTHCQFMMPIFDNLALKYKNINFVNVNVIKKVEWPYFEAYYSGSKLNSFKIDDFKMLEKSIELLQFKLEEKSCLNEYKVKLGPRWLANYASPFYSILKNYLH